MPDQSLSVAGVRFRNAGKISYYHTAGMRLEPGEWVVVETVRGPELARVVIAPDQVVVNELNNDDLKPILRLATEDDVQHMHRLREQAEELLPEARRLAEDARFPARIDSADFTLDGRRLTLSFTSEERLDYRDYLRRASDLFGVKVDMRQLGARDRAKMAGGYGICGRELCCSNWLTTFPAISIRMAKEQDLPLNPQKISGLCGRLLCCLSYEEEGYKEMRRTLPKVGQRCSTPTGEGRVIGVNILRRQVTLVVEGQRINVEDRDLGTVVRWDPASKAGDPPPSISRADAIAQGLIEATEEDLRPPAAPEEPDWITSTPQREPTGRGRLPGGGPRKEIRRKPTAADTPTTPPPARGPGGGRNRPAANQPAAGARGEGQRPRGPQRSGAGNDGSPSPAPRRRPTGGRPAQPGQGTPTPPGLQGRRFERSASSPPPPPRTPRTPSSDSAPDTPGPDGAPRRRGRRGGRGRGPAGDGAGAE